jgi:hypothetical protein
MDGGTAIHVVGRLLFPVFTDSRAWDTLVNRHMNVAAKSRLEPTQSVIGRPRGWAGQPALGPL